MYNTEGVYYDVNSPHDVLYGPVIIRPPDVFEDTIVHTIYDVYLWDPVCKERKVTESIRAYEAKIHDDIVVWKDRRHGSDDIYMARIPESCCGGTDHPFPTGDCHRDCHVNLLDLAILASHWLEGTGQQLPDGEGPYGMPNPSAVYCGALGYKYKIVTRDNGGQYGVCIFPDGNECEAWAFYRGKVYQQWSYCELYGYDLKDLEPHEGSVRGAVCIDKTTQDEIGTVYVLFVEQFMSKPPDYPVGDLSHDLRVNFIDLAILASHWLESTLPDSD
jgi:putative hemolysin